MTYRTIFRALIWLIFMMSTKLSLARPQTTPELLDRVQVALEAQTSKKTKVRDAIQIASELSGRNARTFTRDDIFNLLTREVTRMEHELATKTPPSAMPSGQLSPLPGPGLKPKNYATDYRPSSSPSDTLTPPPPGGGPVPPPPAAPPLRLSPTFPPGQRSGAYTPSGAEKTLAQRKLAVEGGGTSDIESKIGRETAITASDFVEELVTQAINILDDMTAEIAALAEKEKLTYKNEVDLEFAINNIRKEQDTISDESKALIDKLPSDIPEILRKSIAAKMQNLQQAQSLTTTVGIRLVIRLFNNYAEKLVNLTQQPMSDKTRKASTQYKAWADVALAHFAGPGTPVPTEESLLSEFRAAKRNLQDSPVVGQPRAQAKTTPAKRSNPAVPSSSEAELARKAELKNDISQLELGLNEILRGQHKSLSEITKIESVTIRKQVLDQLKQYLTLLYDLRILDAGDPDLMLLSLKNAIPAILDKELITQTQRLQKTLNRTIPK